VPSETEIIRVRGCDWWQAIQARRAQRFKKVSSGARIETTTQYQAGYPAPIRSFFREMVRTAEAWYYHPDMAMCWIQPAVKAAVNMSARKRPDVIWATGAPWSAFIVAQRVAQRTGVPYILDFRSSWTLVPSPEQARRPAWAKRRDQRTLYKLFEEAQAVVFFYDTEAECFWRAYPGVLDAARIHIIPNGYDGTIKEFALSRGDKCTILYAGTLSSYRYDTLLQAVHKFKQVDPTQAKKLRLLFVGEGMETLASEAAALGLSDIVVTAGPTSHTEVTRLQQEAHALLMLGRPSTHKGYELLAGAKLFGYLQAGRPIIGVLPRDEARKVLQRVGVTTVADVDSTAEIVSVLQKFLDAWAAGTLSALIPERAACEVYSAQRQTAALVRALEGAPAAEPFVPGSVEIPPSLLGDIGARWARER
jgi:glycosyltransferase involved in cell wall biosynthesis